MSRNDGGENPVSPVIAGETSNKDRTLLIADDDAAFRNRIARALELRGFIVTAVGSVAEAVKDAEVVMREIVQDSAGEWTERAAALQLQEDASK